MQYMTLNGTYEHEKILREENLGMMEDSIVWANIRNRVQEALGDETMIPLPDRWFHVRSRSINPEGYKPAANPEKFVASTGGKRAAGYGRASQLPVEVVKYWLANTDSVATGISSWADNVRATCEKHALLTVVPKVPSQISDESQPELPKVRKPKTDAA